MYTPLAIEQIRQHEDALRRRSARGSVTVPRAERQPRPSVRRPAALRLALGVIPSLTARLRPAGPEVCADC